MKFETFKGMECGNDAVASEGAEELGLKKMLVAGALGTAGGIISGVVANVITDKVRGRATRGDDSPAAKNK